MTGSTVAPPQASRELLAVIADASRRARELGDDYLSTEHLLIGIAAKGGQAGELLEQQGAGAKKLLDAFEKARGGRRVTHVVVVISAISIRSWMPEAPPPATTTCLPANSSRVM